MIVTFPSITSTCCLLGFVTYPLSLLQNYENLICSVLRFIFQIFFTLPYTDLQYQIWIVNSAKNLGGLSPPGK